ncbi:MAG: PKD domain-containing protein, partial [Bacteroidota bacterium]
MVDSIDLITSWSWSFPGGVPSTSSSQNPVVTWTAQGVYIVCLTIVTMNSCMDTFCDSILIEPCTGFDINYTVINESYPGASDGMILTNVTGGNPPYSYLWSNSAVTQNISGLTSGQYCVTVTDTDSCLLIECMYVNLDSAVFCNADFNIQPAYCQNCFGFPDTSTASGTINSWYWDFGDGSWSNLQNPEHTYQDSGFYQVCLTITTDDSCTSTFCDSVYAQYNLVTYSISGLVYANSAMLPSGTAELYDSSLPQGNPPFYTQTITNGIYYFPSVAAGNYKLLAVPGLPESDDYADTWFGDATAFSSAYTLPVYANLISVDIHLVYTSGISQNESQGSFLVYPNPVGNLLYIQFTKEST